MFQPTQEQKAIINTLVKPGEILKIIAFAGTGKTTTFREYTKAYPLIKFLYIAFNKSVQEEANRTFPRNVICRTAHSIAFQFVGKYYKEKLIPGYKAWNFKQTFKLSSFELAQTYIDIINNYFVSEDEEISEKHLTESQALFLSNKPKLFEDTKKKEFEKIKNSLNQILNRIFDPEDLSAQITHDGYLKLFQIQKINIQEELGIDIILLDEAQDTNPVTCACFLNKNIGIIVCGDSHQQIYKFRGAEDFLEKVNATKTLYLTKSFRFPPYVGNLATTFLKKYKNETKKLKGNEQLKRGNFDFNNFTYITRTNIEIFNHVVSTYKHKKIGFIGDINGYRFNDIKDAYYLEKGEKEKIQNPYIKKFPSFMMYENYAKRVYDVEILGIISCLKQCGDEIPQIVSDVERCHVPPDMANIVYTTAHKCKGLEWQNVLLANDFKPVINKKGMVDIEEVNLLYVAMTRAMSSLRFKAGHCLEDFLFQYNQKQKVA